MASRRSGRVPPRCGRHGGEPRRPPSGAPRGRSLAGAPSRSSAPSPWWRTARACCSVRVRAATGRGATTLWPPVGSLVALRSGMLCPTDRQSFGHALGQEAAARGVDLFGRVEGNPRPARARRCRPTAPPRRRSTAATRTGAAQGRRHPGARVVEDRPEGIAGAEPLYRLMATRRSPIRPRHRRRNRRRNRRPRITSAGRSRGRRMRRGHTRAGHAWSGAARHPSWCGGRSGACRWRTSPYAVCCTGRRRGPMRTRAGSPSRTRCAWSGARCRRKLPRFAALSPSREARPA